MDTNVLKWALDNGYNYNDFGNVDKANEIQEAYDHAHGKGKKRSHTKKTVDVFVTLPGATESVPLGTMENRKKNIRTAVLAWILANGHKFDKEDLLNTRIETVAVTDSFSALGE